MAAWTREAMEKLIRLYKTQPCLYNSHLREFRDQTIKKRSWEYLRQNLQDVRRGVTAEQVKNKISSMRGQLSAEYAKLRYNQNYEPKLWFFKDLEFLKEFTRNASAERNTPTPNRMNESFDEASRDSTPSRNSISSPASFLETHQSIRNSPIIARMRPGVSSPANSLYGEEAEPFVAGAATQLPDLASRSFEAIADDIPTTSKYSTATYFDSAIFDQKTASFNHPRISSPDISPLISRGDQPPNEMPVTTYRISYSPDISPLNRRGDQLPGENFSAFSVPVTSTPLSREASLNNSTESSSNIFSPPRRLIINEEDAKNSYEVIVLTDSESSLAESRCVKSERTDGMNTRTEEEPRIRSCEIETQTELIPQLVPKDLVESSVQTEELPQLTVKILSEMGVQTQEEENLPQLTKSYRSLGVQIEENMNQNQEEPQPSTSGNIDAEAEVRDENLSRNKEDAQTSTSEIIEDKSEAQNENLTRNQNELQPSTSGSIDAKPEVRDEHLNESKKETQPAASQNSEAKSDARKEDLTRNQDEPHPSTSGVKTTQGNCNIHKRKLSPVMKEIPAEESDSEYFSAEENTPNKSPAPKRPKIRHVTSATVLPNYFQPIRELDEADIFGNLVAIKLKPYLKLPEERNRIETDILSAFTPPKKKVYKFWPF